MLSQLTFFFSSILLDDESEAGGRSLHTSKTFSSLRSITNSVVSEQLIAHDDNNNIIRDTSIYGLISANSSIVEKQFTPCERSLMKRRGEWAWPSHQQKPFSSLRSKKFGFFEKLIAHDNSNNIIRDTSIYGLISYREKHSLRAKQT